VYVFINPAEESWLELVALFDDDVRCRKKDRYCGDDGEGGEGYQTEP
jgi:hypothetical protein